MHTLFCLQVFGAIEGDVDATHRIMHNALSGYSSARLWRLTSLEGYEPPSDKQLEPELAKEFEAWRCTDASCDGSACTLWHDERELRFAKVSSFNRTHAVIVAGCCVFHMSRYRTAPSFFTPFIPISVW